MPIWRKGLPPDGASASKMQTLDNDCNIGGPMVNLEVRRIEA
jgi:hypothetical protein